MQQIHRELISEQKHNFFSTRPRRGKSKCVKFVSFSIHSSSNLDDKYRCCLSSSCLIRVDQIFFSPNTERVGKLLRDACKHSKTRWVWMCAFVLSSSCWEWNSSSVMGSIKHLWCLHTLQSNKVYKKNCLKPRPKCWSNQFLLSDSLLGSASEEEEDDDNSTASSVMKHHSIHSSLPPAPGETNNNSLPHSDISSSIGQVRIKRKTVITLQCSWTIIIIVWQVKLFLFASEDNKAIKTTPQFRKCDKNHRTIHLW